MDKSTLEEIIAGYQDGLYRFALFNTRSSEDAKDIVQNVFVNMYCKCRTETVKDMKAYLYKCVRNACLNFRRDSKQQAANDQDQMLCPPDEVATQILLHEQSKVIESLLRRLPPEQAEVIRLRIIDELTFAEIAALQEEPSTTVKSRFKYGIDKLKQVLKSKECYYEMF